MTDPLTNDELALIKQRCEAATPGPWEPKYPHSDDYLNVRLFAGTEYLGSITNSDQDADTIKANADFIAAARTDIPRLVAEVERLQRELAVAQATIQKLLREASVVTVGSGTLLDELSTNGQQQ